MLRAVRTEVREVGEHLSDGTLSTEGISERPNVCALVECLVNFINFVETSFMFERVEIRYLEIFYSPYRLVEKNNCIHG